MQKRSPFAHTGSRRKLPFPFSRCAFALDIGFGTSAALLADVQRFTRQKSELWLQQSAEQNLFLRSLPSATYALLEPFLEAREMRSNDSLWEVATPVEWVYFPRSFVGSILIPLSDGDAVEAATVGREGFLGTTVVSSSGSTTSRAIAQVPGDGARISSANMQALLFSDEQLLRHSLRYLQALQEQTAQSVACNSRHSLTQRCARWLLMTHDRVGRDEFVLMQAFLAAMLGVHRPRVTVVARQFQAAGLIYYRRGTIRILDRAGLEAASCECYAVVRRGREASMGAPTP